MTEQQIISLCEKGQFSKALTAIDQSIKQAGNRTSNIFRLRGQINMSLGNHEESINDLIEALKIEPKNIEALTLIGNIYGGAKNDIDTAMIYYDKVLELRPKDHLAISNIASMNAKSGKFEVAIELFNKALIIKPNFANALYGKALAFFRLEQYNQAFEYCTLVMKNVKPINNEYKQILTFSLNLMKEMGSIVASDFDKYPKTNPLLEELKKKSDKEIITMVDESITTPAKIEIAEYRNQLEHIIKYKKDNPLHHHLFYHELMHLKLVFEAREDDANELFVSTPGMFSLFKTKYKELEKNLHKKGLPSSYAGDLYRQLFDGLNLQLYNAPVDLFIEDYIYNNYVDVRPIQFLSLLQMIETVFQGADSPQLKGLIPPKIRETNIILAVPQILHFKDLFGIDLTHRIKEKHLISKGTKLYQDFLQLRKDRTPGEEYDMIRWWGEEVNLTPFFKLNKEDLPKSVAKSKFTPEELISQIENDPYELETDRTAEDGQMSKFQEAQEELGLNMAVVMYMKGALSYMKDLPIQEVKKIGFEIAEIGRYGIDPAKDDTYNLRTVPNKKFSGWKMLSWMYVAYSIFEPGLEKQLGLNFENELKMAAKI